MTLKRWWVACALMTAGMGAMAQGPAPEVDAIVPPQQVAMSPVTGEQGYATDGTLHYVSSTNHITAYDAQWNEVWTQKDPFGTLFDASVQNKHVGDIDVYDGKIYAPVETYHSCDDNTLQKIVVYSAKDGSFQSFTDVSPYKHEISSVTIVPSTQSMYVTSFCEPYEIPHYDLKTMKPLEPLKLDFPITKMQGISWSEKRQMFVVTSDSPVQRTGYVWGVTPQGHVTLLYTTPQSGELEGVDYTQDQIRYLLRHVWFLDPAIGKTAPVLTGWEPTIRTTPELSASQQKSWVRLGGDFAQLERYAQLNAALAPVKKGENRVVFYGDSITDAWQWPINNFFPGKGYIDRGISGQTTAQMLIRFRQDVIDLHPVVVVLLAGTNDIAGNAGPASPKMAADNIKSMAELARANGIRFVICSVLPADHYMWRPDVQPAEPIRLLNASLKEYAAKEKLVYVDYYAALVDEKGAMKQGMAKDGVHPTPAGYAVMAPLAEKGIAEALKRKP